MEERQFKAGHGSGDDWSGAVKACLEALGEPPPGANVGILYATEVLADDLASILTFVRSRTGIEHWVGTIGHGIAASGVEYHGVPAVALLVAALPPEAFRVFAPVERPAGEAGLESFRAAHGAWTREHGVSIAVVHADPRTPHVAQITSDLVNDGSLYLIGGLTGGRERFPQIADRVLEGGVSGMLLAPDVPLQVGVAQGCAPLGEIHTITQGSGNEIEMIDERPALDVFKEEIGELLAKDLRRVGGYIFAAFPVTGTDTGDYVVRNLLSIDPARGAIAVAEAVAPGQRIMFCRRDHDAAVEDLRRMVGDVVRRAGPRPKAALYHSCVARGPYLFGDDSAELKLVQETLGDVPLVGFFANGEICNDRLYGYTGVLTVFS